jgi:hypothetical protein
MKDKSLKDDVRYELQFYMPITKRWDVESLQSTLKEVKRIKKICKQRDKRKGFEFEYRIVKLTIKKEVVK